MSKIRQDAVVLGSSVWRCVPSFEREDSHAGNLPADTDLHAFHTDYRDAVHEMRHADAARIDRAPRPQLQSADLQLRALRFRREFFKDAVSKRKL